MSGLLRLVPSEVVKLYQSRITGTGQNNWYGTSLRVYDREFVAWRVTWFNPVTGARNDLVGRRRGADIVQEGVNADGRKIRWLFTDIAPTSFRWLGESLEPDGKTWRLEAEFRARRV